MVMPAQIRRQEIHPSLVCGFRAPKTWGTFAGMRVEQLEFEKAPKWSAGPADSSLASFITMPAATYKLFEIL